MEALNTLQHIHSHFANWQMQQRTSGRIVFWVKEVLAEYIKGDWRVPIRLVEELIGILVFTKKIQMQHICLSILLYTRDQIIPTCVLVLFYRKFS
jgi:hypothetical protein